MTFQFLCPQGHLLQGEEAHMGMQCQCPQCGMAFIIPTIETAGRSSSIDDLIAPVEGRGIELESLEPIGDPIELAPPAARVDKPRPAEVDEIDVERIDLAPPQPESAKRPKSGLRNPGPVDAAPKIELGPPSGTGVGGDFNEQALSEEVLHIPCPNGHELETPLDMVGQRVMCPHCRVEFRLRREKSKEFLRQQDILDRRRGQFWFQLAIVLASFVGFVLAVMFAMMIFA